MSGCQLHSNHMRISWHFKIPGVHPDLINGDGPGEGTASLYFNRCLMWPWWAADGRPSTVPKLPPGQIAARSQLSVGSCRNTWVAICSVKSVFYHCVTAPSPQSHFGSKRALTKQWRRQTGQGEESEPHNTAFGFEVVQSRADLRRQEQAGEAILQRRENSSGPCRMGRVFKEGRGEQHEGWVLKRNGSGWNKRGSGSLAGINGVVGGEQERMEPDDRCEEARERRWGWCCGWSGTQTVSEQRSDSLRDELKVDQCGSGEWREGSPALARLPWSLLNWDARWQCQGPAIRMGREGGGLRDRRGSEPSLHALLFSCDSKTL